MKKESDSRETVEAQRQNLKTVWLENHRKTLDTQLNDTYRKELLWSWLRLGTFIAGVLIVILLRETWLGMIGSGVGILLLFLLAVRHHGVWQDQRKSTENQQAIIKESLHHSIAEKQPIRGTLKPLPSSTEQAPLPTIIETGPTWELSTQEQDDLDLYGEPIGIFGLLNRTSTAQGARRLSELLEHPLLRVETIQERQKAIRWLAENREVRLAMMASLIPLRARFSDVDLFIQLLQKDRPNVSPPIFKIIRLWSILSGLGAIFAILQIFLWQFSWISILIALAIINSTIWHSQKKSFQGALDAMEPFKSLTYMCRCFLAHAECVAAQPDAPPHVAIPKEHLTSVVTKARIPAFCEWLDWSKIGSVLRQPLNLFVFYDIQIAYAVLTCIKKHEQILLKGLVAMTELEALNSLACYAGEQTFVHFPTIQEAPKVHIEDGCHPLLLESFPNSLELHKDERTWVVTGPNAGGKSTFLRMTGINLLLAQIGSAVCAQTMTCFPLRLLTNMRVRDDLAKQESYFMSEVRRLRRIVLDQEQAPPVFSLIDEPFHGTNFPEQRAGSTALLEHLITSGHYGLVATHQDVLTNTADEAPTSANVHFSEHLSDTKIIFDYQLHPGRATSKTAIRILAQEGFPPSLIKRAQALMEESDSKNDV